MRWNDKRNNFIAKEDKNAIRRYFDILDSPKKIGLRYLLSVYFIWLW